MANDTGHGKRNSDSVQYSHDSIFQIHHARLYEPDGSQIGTYIKYIDYIVTQLQNTYINT